ncbi:MAG: HD domain-containing protein [Alphaproteobacteria bacterium]|nr:HD domain-containing protein [Alphaproteobacteria bacterium]
MIKGYPDRQEAFKIWEDGIAFRRDSQYGFDYENEYRFHTLGVAKAASKIASRIPGMDEEEAYILGLLHDYGKKINEKKEGIFHGRVGYEELLKMGYGEAAQICLTHTFPIKNFDDSEYSYPQDWKDWLHKALALIEYSDYDYLIALCDKFFEGLSMVSIEKRVAGIKKRYNLDDKQAETLLDESLRLKDYFDKKTGCDIYDILGIKD